MKKSFAIFVLVGLISLSGFTNQSADFEQITFDYFVSEILKTDYNNVTSFEFKGKTEESFSSLGKFKFCLKPEKLGTIIEDATKGIKRNVKQIEYNNVRGVKITDDSTTGGYRLFIYPSVHVADNYYVFLSFQNKKEAPINYVFELTPEGKISRSCKME